MKIAEKLNLKKNLKKSSWKKYIYIRQKHLSQVNALLSFVNANDKISESMLGKIYFWNIGSTLRSVKIRKGRVNYKFRRVNSKS